MPNTTNDTTDADFRDDAIFSSYTDESVKRKMLTEAVYLTSGCCDPVHGSPELFDELGLDYWRNAGLFDYGPWGEHYPLTEQESQFIGEDWAGQAFGGGAEMGYTGLFRGNKYLMPCINVCHFGAKGPHSRESYGRVLYETLAEAEAVAIRYADVARPEVEAVGGQVIVDPHVEPDRVAIQLLFPFEYAMKFEGRDAWKAHLASKVDQWQERAGTPE